MTSVLVAESDQVHANMVDLALSDHGFSVGVAHSVDEALAALRSRPVNVLLTDLQLGESDGIDLLKAIGRLSPRTRSVLMAGFATARDYQRAVEVGAVRVLCKPFTMQDLLGCVRHAVDCDTGFHGSIHGLSLIDLLQMFNTSRRSISIAVAGRDLGSLYLRDGQIIHALHGRRTGEAALRSLLALPAGAFSTSALPETIEQSITRDFRELLLDALCALDEAGNGNSRANGANTASNGNGQGGAGVVKEPMLLEASQPIPATSATSEPDPPSAMARCARRLLDAVRELDGYVAARVVLSRDGRMVGCDGRLELWQSVEPSWAAPVARRNTERSVEEIVISSTQHYHLLHALDSSIPAFVHLVLERRSANLGMARLALAAAVTASVTDSDI